MRHVYLLLLLAGPLWAQTYQDARTELQRGNYSEAAEAFADLVKNQKDVVASSIGLSLSLQAEGKYDEALVALQKSDDPEILGQRAELLFLRGRWDDAEKTADAALKKNDRHFRARWVLGQLARDRGNWAKAKEDFRWFVKAYKPSENYSPEDLLLIGQAAAEYARYNQLSDQFKVILGLYSDALRADKLFWQAEYRKAELLLEKHNKAEAAIAIERALLINPQSAEVKTLKARAQFNRMETKDVERITLEALDINPAYLEALLLRADLYLVATQWKDVTKTIELLRAVNPRYEPALAVLAAAQIYQRKPEAVEKLVLEVEGFNPRPYGFYTGLAERLDLLVHKEEAEKFYKKAIALEPKLPAAITGLAMLIMRLGDEDQAHELLEQAFVADPFNLQVSNSIKVLNHLKKYQTEKLPGFVFRYDPKNDKILAKFIKKALEELHAEYSAKFEFTPKTKYVVELFNRHEMFSGRLTSMPDLPTYGAVVGTNLAMLSPRDKDRFTGGRPFNWKRIVRHETVHLFNLEQTKNRVPRWFTEGLAVSLEGLAPPPNWDGILARRLAENKVFNLDTIQIAYLRFDSQDQLLAYFQGYLYVEYLMKNYGGDKAIVKLLNAYGAGQDTDAALKEHLGIDKAEFEKGYRQSLEERVKDVKVAGLRKSRTLKALKDANAQNPGDVDTAAELAEEYSRLSKFADAERLVNEVLRTRPNHPLASYVKASLMLREKRVEDAEGVLKASVNADASEPKAVRLLFELQKQMKKTDDAAATLEKGRVADPTNVKYLKDLMTIYLQTKNKDKLVDLLKVVTQFEFDDLDSRKFLCKYYFEKKDYVQAEKYARMCLDIAVDDADVQNWFLESLLEQNKEEEWQTYKKLFEIE